MAKPPRAVDTTPGEADFAQVTPRDLHPLTDIRVVIQEVAKLSTQVERLISDVKDLSAKVDPGQTARLVEDVKGVKDKVDEIRHTVSTVRGMMIAISGILGLIATVTGIYFGAKKAFAPTPVAIPAVSNVAPTANTAPATAPAPIQAPAANVASPSGS